MVFFFSANDIETTMQHSNFTTQALIDMNFKNFWNFIETIILNSLRSYWFFDKVEGLSEFSAKRFIWYSPIDIQFIFMQIAVISCRYFCYNSLRLQVFVTPTLWEQHIIISQPVRLLMWLAYEITIKQSSFYICFYINVFYFYLFDMQWN